MTEERWCFRNCDEASHVDALTSQLRDGRLNSFLSRGSPLTKDVCSLVYSSERTRSTRHKSAFFEWERSAQLLMTTNHKRPDISTSNKLQRRKTRAIERTYTFIMPYHGSKILCQKGEARNGDIPLPPAKGKIKSKPGITRKSGGKHIQFANWNPSHQRTGGRLSGTDHLEV